MDDEERAKLAASQLQIESRRIMSSLLDQRAALWRLLWENEGGIPPQDILDALGPAALEIFQLSGALEAFLGTIVLEIPGGVGSPYNFTVNADGTITLGELRG